MKARARASTSLLPALRLLIAGWLLCGAFAGSTPAAAPGHDAPSTADDAPRWVFFPDDDVYPQYIADPMRLQSAMLLAGFPSSGL
jgi:hypothetical protein